MNLATLLKAARAEKGLSLSSAASRLGVVKSYLHDLEAGDSKNPSLRLILAFLSVYKLGMGEIIEAGENSFNGRMK